MKTNNLTIKAKVSNNIQRTLNTFIKQSIKPIQSESGYSFQPTEIIAIFQSLNLIGDKIDTVYDYGGPYWERDYISYDTNIDNLYISYYEKDYTIIIQGGLLNITDIYSFSCVSNLCELFRDLCVKYPQIASYIYRSKHPNAPKHAWVTLLKRNNSFVYINESATPPDVDKRHYKTMHISDVPDNIKLEIIEEVYNFKYVPNVMSSWMNENGNIELRNVSEFGNVWECKPLKTNYIFEIIDGKITIKGMSLFDFKKLRNSSIQRN